MALTIETAPIGLYVSCDTQACKAMAYSSYYDRYEEDIDLTDMRALNERAQHSHHESLEAFKEQGWEFARGQWHCPQHAAQEAVLERNLKAFKDEINNPIKPTFVATISETRKAPRFYAAPQSIKPRPVRVVTFLGPVLDHLGKELP